MVGREDHDDAQASRRALEALARKKPAEKPRVEPLPRAAVPDELRNPLLDRALSHAWWVGVVCAAVILATMFALGLAFGGDAAPAGAVLGLFVGSGLAIPVLFVCQRMVAAQQRRWLATLPFELRGYRGYLGTEHPASVTMTVAVELDVTDEKDRAVAADAVVAAMPGAHAAFDGDRLVIRSPAIYARFGRKRGRPRTTPSNHLLHAWFQRLVKRVLLTIARAHTVRAVTVK